MQPLVSDLLQGKRRSIARLISMIENDDPAKRELLAQIYSHTGKAYVIGITGAPGSGKSSLVDGLLYQIRKEGLTVGIIAVDPTSPFTGGAILGDRIRMQDHALDPGIFVRSMGTRGSLGGLSRSTREAIHVLDAFGKDIIIVETVGVGQSEVDIVKTADTTLVVLTPAGGDGVQTIKAGIMEIADVFVINKADLPNADRMASEVNMMLDMNKESQWKPSIVQTVSIKEQNIDKLWEALKEHRSYMENSGRLEEIRRSRVTRELTEQVEYLVKNRIWEEVKGKFDLENLLNMIAKREKDPYSASYELLSEINVLNGKSGKEGV